MNIMPIDEYIFWKTLIEKKQEAGESVPAMAHELLEHAEKKTLLYLMDKYDADDLENEVKYSLH